MAFTETLEDKDAVDRLPQINSASVFPIRYANVRGAVCLVLDTDDGAHRRAVLNGRVIEDTGVMDMVDPRRNERLKAALQERNAAYQVEDWEQEQSPHVTLRTHREGSRKRVRGILQKT